MSTLVHDALIRSGTRFPEKTALVCGGRRYTYRSLEQMSNRLANALLAWGVRRGDRVALYLPNSIDAVTSIYAALKAGAVVVPVNRGARTDKLAAILRNCRASVLLTGPKAASDGIVDEMSKRVPSLRRVVVEGQDIETAQGEFAPMPLARVNIDRDLAFIIYTSGSTGEPKGVMCDHSNVVFAVDSITRYLQNTPDDVVLNVLPLSFDYGLYQALMTFTFGGTLILENSFAYPVEVLKRVAAERVTGLPGVPTLFAGLLQLDLSTFDLSSLRYVTNTAAALPVSHILELRRRLPGARVYSMYGLTETKRTLYLPPEDLERKPGSVGIAIPGTEVWLEDERGNRLGPESTGELIVRGRHVMRGYWEAPEDTAARFRPGPYPGEHVCATGDLFRIDQDGYFYFVARKDDIIKSRGEKVAPKEVENVLYGLPGVVEAAVVPVQDPLLGQAVKAVIVRRNGITQSDVLAHCRSNLEPFAVPKYVEFRDALPKTSSGKIARMELS